MRGAGLTAGGFRACTLCGALLFGAAPRAGAYLAVSKPPRVEGVSPLTLGRGASFDEGAVRAWTKAEHLPATSVFDIAEDDEGILYLATEEGVGRFDGQELVTADKREARALGVFHGAVFVATRADGVFVLKQGRVQPSAITAATKAHTGNAMATTADGVYVGTGDGRVLLLDETSVHFSVGPEDGLPAGRVQALATAADGIWVGTSAGLRLLDPASRRVQVPSGLPPAAEVTGLAWDSPRLVVATGAHGLWSCEAAACRPVPLPGSLAGARVAKMCSFPGGGVLAWSSLGLLRVDAGGVSLVSAAFRNSTGGFGAAIFSSKTGMVWLGAGDASNFEGLRALTFRGVSTIFPALTPRTLFETDGGALLVGTASDGLWRQGTNGAFAREPLAVPGLTSLRTLEADGDALLVTGFKGAVRMEKSGAQGILVGDADPFSSIRSIWPRGDGSYLLGTNQGLWLRSRDGQVTFMKDAVSPTEMVMGIASSSKDHFFLSTFAKGLFSWPWGGHARSVPLPKPDAPGETFHYTTKAVGIGGGLWVVGGDGGLCAVRSEWPEGRCFGPSAGLQATSHFSPVKDGQGRLWMATNVGITSLDEDEFRQAVEHGLPTGRFRSVRHFTTRDGLPVDECNAGNPGALRLSDGRMAFACVGGVVLIDPKKARIDASPPHVLVESVEVDGRLYDAPFSEPLAADAQRLTFKFSAPAFLGDEKKQQFMTRLEGFDRDWVAGDRTTLRATYTNLPRGRALSFSVRACNFDGVWNESAATFAFRIAPRWYERVVVQLSGALGFFGLIAVGYQWQMAQMKARASALKATVLERTSALTERTRSLEERTSALVEERDRSAMLENRTKVLAEAGQRIASTLEIDSIVGALREYVVAHFDAPSFGVALIDDGAAVLRYRGALYGGQELAPYERSLANQDQLAVWCVENRAPVIIGDADVQASRYIANYEKFAHGNATDVSGALEQSILYLPLLGGGRCLGIITVQSPRKGAYTSADLDVFLTLASYASSALGNAQAYEQIHELFAELQSAQTQLVHGEKMAALGRVAAGVAHEINNPLGAIKASAEAAGRGLEDSLETFPRLLETLKVEEKDAVFRLVARFREVQRSGALSARERRAKRRDFRDRLAQANVVEPDRAAELLVDAGCFDLDDGEIALLAGPNATLALDVGQSIGGALRSVRIISEAVERTSKIVFALKNYTRIDRTGECTVATLASGVETVLTLYHSMMTASVKVSRHVDEGLPPISAHHDELIQVWTNLVHNALQSMPKGGTLTVSVAAGDGGQLVLIGDTGTGISPEVLPRIFEAFFTTKTAGEGTGLGLDICRGIVDKHGGRISVETELGRGTTFQIWIPMEKSS